jgi:hypothetical protein
MAVMWRTWGVRLAKPWRWEQGMNGERPRWAMRLQVERETREWNKKEMARRLLRAEGLRQGSATNLARQIRRWEAGEVFPRDWASAYATAFGMERTELFGSEPDARHDSPDDLGEPMDLFDAVCLAGGSGRPIDAGYVESIRRTNQALVRLDTLYGGDELFPLGLRVFRDVNRRLATGAYEPQVERDLMAATGETGEVVAWLAYDADRQTVSRQLIQEAMMLSRQAGDRDMELFELTHLAMQSVHLHRPAEALRITSDLLDGGRLTPRVAAVLEIRRGRALAQLGDEGRAMAALGRVRATVADGIGARDPHWTWWVNDVEVAWHLGMARAELGDWAGAVPLFHESATRRAAHRRARYNDLAHLLNALVHVGDWQEAEPVMVEAATLVTAVGSTRTTNLLHRVTDRVARASAPSTMTDLADDLGRALTDGDMTNHAPNQA